MKISVLQIIRKTLLHIVKESKESVFKTLEAPSLPLFAWFNNNFINANSDKSHILLSCSVPSTTLIDDSYTESNTKEILLVITTDRDLKSDHVNNLNKKVC